MQFLTFLCQTLNTQEQNPKTFISTKILPKEEKEAKGLLYHLEIIKNKGTFNLLKS